MTAVAASSAVPGTTEAVGPVRDRPLRETAVWLRWYILVAALAWATAASLAAWTLRLPATDARFLSVMLACAVVTAELTRRADPAGRLPRDSLSVWYLPVAALLPPGWAFLVPVPLAAFARWRVHRIPGYWRIITGSCLGLSYGAASLAFHGIDALVGHALEPGTMSWVLAVAASGVLRWAISSALVLIAARGVDSQMRLRPLLRIGDLVSSDLAELCIGILVTFGAAASPWYAILAVPFVTPLHRSRQHAQLARTARTDAKTGLLNAAAWQQAASAEITRAARTRRPLAMAMVDIDHFKAVNDTYGHLAGDRVLAAVADILTTHLRSYDAAGRFGGEEFALLLPDTTDTAARQIAERLRVKIAATPVLAATTRGAVRGGVTVSIGVAALRPQCRTAEELIAAADAALYEAKRAGRDCVRIVGPVSGPTAGNSLTAASGHPPCP